MNGETTPTALPNALLSFERVSKSFFGVPVLKEVTLRVPAGGILGLVGENGAGKSTLMNVAGGVIRPDSGRMTLNGAPYAPASPAEATAAGIAFIHQELNLFTNLTVAENIFIGGFPRAGRLPFLDRGAMRRLTRQYLDAVNLDVSPDTPVEKLSPGERQLVEIAKALSSDAKLFIFDEPTTSLTARETEHLFGLIERLRDGGASIVYISHILADVLRLAGEVAVLRDGELVANAPAQEFTVRKMISAMVGRDIEQLYPERSAAPSREPALEVRGLSLRGIVEDISFTLYKGEVLGVFGLMGSGRTELARLLFGLDGCERGEIRVGDAAYAKPSPRRSLERGMAFVTESRREEGLLMEIPIADNIALASLNSYARADIAPLNDRRLYGAIGGVVDSLKIKAGDIRRQAVKTLSGGNQQKAVIGKWLLRRPAVFVIDEPTRGVDVGAKHEIYSIINGLAEQGAGVFFISSELEELLGCCDRILVMGNGEIQATFARGDFDKERILRAAFREQSDE